MVSSKNQHAFNKPFVYTDSDKTEWNKIGGIDMQTKTKLGLSFALAAVLVVGQVGFASEDDHQGGMMSGNGMSGMMQMMENENMGKMMDAVNSPEGQKMLNACGDVMESYEDDEKETEKSDL
jgi:hypothetical protein